MNKMPIPLKIVTPKNKRLDFTKYNDSFTLDINGRSCSPQNQQQNNFHVWELSRTIGSDYQSKKFKIRMTSNSVKTSRNWNYFPFQRIKKVENIIKNQKKKQQQKRANEKGEGTQRKGQFGQKEGEEKGRLGKSKYIELMDLGKGRENMRLKQIQQIIRNQRHKIKQKSVQKGNVIRFQRKIQNMETNEVINSYESIRESLEKERQKIGNARLNKVSNLYSDIVKNRKRLSDKRRAKKRNSENSLLSRINLINNYQENTFVLRNSPRLLRETD